MTATAYLIAVIDVKTLKVKEVFIASAKARSLTMRRGQYFADIGCDYGQTYHDARRNLLLKIDSLSYLDWVKPLLHVNDR